MQSSEVKSQSQVEIKDAKLGMENVAESAGRLVNWFATCESMRFLIAFSGGVDSAVVAAAASKYLAKQPDGQASVRLVTGRSPSLSTREYEDAVLVAKQLELDHQFLETAEIEDPAYARNDSQRCYHCKKHLFAAMHELEAFARDHCSQLISGTNADDLGDYRPGLKAASEANVRAPLAELGIGKAMVYELAKRWSLPISDKPASPCLSSRLAYGVAVTDERLRMVERGESYLRDLGVFDCRVRLHEGDMARIELPMDVLRNLFSTIDYVALVDFFKSLGFRCVTLDLEGLRSGSLNQLVGITLPK